MLIPNFLKKGSCIGVPAPSSGAYDELHINKYNNAKSKLEQDGYEIVLSKNINCAKKGRSASSIERAQEFNDMLEDDNVDFIICAAGGEFLVECLPFIDFENIKKHPKFIQGFSDPTGILYVVTTKCDIATIYGNNFGDYGCSTDDRSIIDAKEIISGNLISQNNYDMYENEWAPAITGLEGYNFTDKVEWKILEGNQASFKGRIIGGCIDIIAEIAGTTFDGTAEFNEKYKNDGIVWYFDNCELSMEELIRTLWKLDILGYFKYAKGFIFGRNGNFSTCLDYTMEEALKDSAIYKYNVPIIYDADISHKGPCLTIINGAIAEVQSSNGSGRITFSI